MTIGCLNFYSGNLSRFQYFDRKGKGNTHQGQFSKIRTPQITLAWRILPKQRVVYIVYFYAILFYFVDYGIPLSQIKIVLFILANRECLIIIFAGQ
jgi:hypothetical protein